MKSHRNLVPMDAISTIADTHAFELWGEGIARGEPMPLSDEKGVYAYVFLYARDSAECPSEESLIEEVRALRHRHKTIDRHENSSAYYADLRKSGSRFGSVCVSATYDNVPVLWASHFLPPNITTGERAREEAERRLGGRTQLRQYFYYSPEHQYFEFGRGSQTVLIDGASPDRDEPAEMLLRRPEGPRPETLPVDVKQAWSRLSLEFATDTAAPVFPAGEGVSPIGLDVKELAETHTTKKIAHWELIPKVDHTPKNWCVPTSWAMVLGFYDNYVKSKGTFTGYGRLIDYWYELTPGGYNLPNLIDDLLSSKAAAINGYTFPETKTNGNHSQQWNALKAEVDAGRPCFFNIAGHTMAAFGYRVSSTGQKFGIVYDPPNPNVPTYEHEESIANCTGIGSVAMGGGLAGQNLIIIEPDGGEKFSTSAPGEVVWFVWGDSIKKTRLSISMDGGNTWSTIAGNIPTKGAWNGWALTPSKTSSKTRVRLEGLAADNTLIAADGSFENFAVEQSPNAGGWKQIWGPTDRVIASSVGGKPVPTLYATSLSGDGIYRYDGTPMNWTKIGGPGKMFVVDDQGHLYGLGADGNAVFRYDGTPNKWTKIGGPADAIYAGGGRLFATNPKSGEILQYNGNSWTQIGGPGKAFAVDGKGRLYGVSPDASGIYRYDGTPLQWTKIGDKSTALYAGGCGLFSYNDSKNEVFCYSLVPMKWTKVGGPGRMFAVDDTGRLYGLAPDANAVFRYDGNWKDPHEWTKIGGPADAIFAAGQGRLFATSPQTKNLMAYQ